MSQADLFAADAEYKNLLHPDFTLYRLCTEDAQTVAEARHGRKLTEQEVYVVNRIIGETINETELFADCIASVVEDW